MNCPACKSATVEQGFEGLQGARVQLDVCHTCHGLWFDARESRQLTSKGVLRLFHELHGRKDQHYRLSEPLACPRCRATLTRTHDMARGNRFQYYRCAAGHGHFITFFQFLREKGIVRGLTPRELNELKKHAQSLQCSDCGGPISLAKDTACPRCNAPLCILDPKAPGSALGDLPKAAAMAGAMAASSPPPADTSSFFDPVDYVDLGVDAVDLAVTAATDGVDLVDVGVDFFLDIVGGISDLF